MIMRRRPLLRAAAMGGTAYVVGKRAGQASAARASQDGPSGDLGEHESEPGQRAASAATAPSMLDQLNQLTGLHQQGALTDDEFAAAKAKLLGS
jgi:Short C-terminal domain